MCCWWTQTDAPRRFQAIGVESTEKDRRAYRALLLITPGLGEHIILKYYKRQSRQDRDFTAAIQGKHHRLITMPNHWCGLPLELPLFITNLQLKFL
jgi:hypothetical protein